jgi:hypothetical protein
MRIPPRRPRCDLRRGHVKYMVENAALGQVFFKYFGFPCPFHRLPHTHHQLPSGAGTILEGLTVADVPSSLSLSPTQRILKHKIRILSTGTKIHSEKTCLKLHQIMRHEIFIEVKFHNVGYGHFVLYLLVRVSEQLAASACRIETSL